MRRYDEDHLKSKATDRQIKFDFRLRCRHCQQQYALEMAKEDLEEARRITNKDIAAELGGLPVKMHCPTLPPRFGMRSTAWTEKGRGPEELAPAGDNSLQHIF